MAKDPAFLFYPGDWNGGTMHLDRYSKGCYIDLLILQFNRGHMTIDMIGQVLGQDMDKYWPKIQDKFKKDGENYYNEKLRSEIEKRKAYTESRKNNLTGKNQYTKKEGGHTTPRMENVNGDLIINDSNLINRYGQKMIDSFLNYWNEKNKKGKCRWQLQKTFEVNRRLVTWHNNNFGGEKQKSNNPARNV